MRIVFWNIMAGGGKRADAIVAQLAAWQPTLVALAEFRATPPSQAIASQLADLGFAHQLTTADEAARARNALLLASKYPLRAIDVQPSPLPAHRWLLARVSARRAFALGVMHIPNMHTGLKVPYHQAVLSIVGRWTNGPGLLIGDTNTGLPGIDEEAPTFTAKEVAFIEGMAAAGWPDTFREVHGQKRAYTWYSPNKGNGFRLDQAFANPSMADAVRSFEYVWGRAAGFRWLSDHAAILLDLNWV